MAGYQLSKKQIVQEIIKCGKDPTHFINNYVKISHPLEGQIPFKTFDFQADLLEDFNDYRFNIVLKARQLGISTIVAAYVAWMMVFHRDKNILVIATKFGTATNLVKKVKSMIKNLPDWVRIADVSIDNRASFELSNGSQIKASSTSGDAGRSEALSLLVIDEAAHVEGLDELWTGLYPTLSTGGRCIALSTPNGVGNWFHQTYIDAETQDNDFYPTNLPWSVHPDRGQEWFEKETRNMSRRQIAQELECNFNTSGDSVIHPDDIGRMEEHTVAEPKYKTGFDRNVWIWEPYEAGYTYVLVADVARGDGRDHSAFHIINVDKMEQVAEYQGKPNLEMYALLLNQMGREYGDCLLVVENNNIGFSVLEKLAVDHEYPNLYHSVKSSHEYVDSVIAEHQSNTVAGFTTSMKTRPLIIAKLEEFIRNQLITLRSVRLMNELRTFVWTNGRAQAMRGYNDDLTMSIAIACWVKDTALSTNKRAMEYNKAFISSMTTNKISLNTTIPGMNGYKEIKNSDNIAKQKNFEWLYKG
jgi:hypothetical protein